MAEVVIFLPGIMGSQLLKGDVLVWPGKATEVLFPYSKMDLLLDPDLEVGDIIRKVSISNQYQSLMEDFGKCGFGEAGAKPTLKVCPYDWRKDNKLAAERLADAVRAARSDHGKDVVINLVAHSMGGLVSRHFLESGNYNEANCNGFGNISRLITIGTPHRGAPLALCAALGQIKRLFLNKEQVKTLASRPEFPSLYQLMPPNGEPFFWNTDPQARLAPISLANQATVQRLGLQQSGLDSAAAFHSSLSIDRKPEHVEYFCFVGTRQSTIGNVQANFSAGNLRPLGVEVADGGDGTVPSWSASFAGMQQLAVGGEHGGLYKSPEVLRALGSLLGKQGVLSSEILPNQVRISVRDEVVVPGAKEPVVLFMNTAASKLKAHLVIQKVTGSDGVPLAHSQEIQRLPVSYEGAPIESLSLTVIAPEYPGVYEFYLEGPAGILSENTPDLLVQGEL